MFTFLYEDLHANCILVSQRKRKVKFGPGSLVPHLQKEIDCVPDVLIDYL